MSTTESAPVFVTDDNKDFWASTVWWNGCQQLPLSAAVNNFSYDDLVPYDAIASCDENNSGQFYNIPMIDTSVANQWPTVVNSAAADDEELYANATPMSSVVDHAYKYPTTHDYAMLECYAAVTDPSAVNHAPWTSVPYADTTSSVSGYEVCCSVAMPAASMDYCNSLQMMQCGAAAFNGFSIPASQFQIDVDHVRQQCDTSSHKTPSTYTCTV